MNRRNLETMCGNDTKVEVESTNSTDILLKSILNELTAIKLNQSVFEQKVS